MLPESRRDPHAWRGPANDSGSKDREKAIETLVRVRLIGDAGLAAQETFAVHKNAKSFRARAFQKRNMVLSNFEDDMN